MMQLGKAGVIGRFKPLHLGGAVLLDNICKQANHVIIGVGSCNKYDLRNPFTAGESMSMIEAFLMFKYNNYELVQIPDFGQIPEYADGQMWRSVVKKEFKTLDYFISGNDYTRELLKNDYKLLHPGEIVPREEWIKLRATQIRYEMALNRDWENLVPHEVAAYIKKNGLDERFRKEFGLATIAGLAGTDVGKEDELAEERAHIVNSS